MCEELSDPANGNIQQMRPAVIGSVATYKCNRVFRLVGNASRICQASGSYSGQAPTCVGMFKTFP